MSTIVDIDNFIINYLTQEQYDEALENEQIDPDQLYLTPVNNNNKIPTKLSELTNDVGYITLSDLPIYDGGVS